MGIASHPVLLLNADFRPMSYFPLSLISWQDAIKAIFLERVNIVSEYNTIIRSENFKMKIPSVISLKTYVHFHSRPTFNRYNLFLRDDFTCQYCLNKFHVKQLTFDHVIPKCRKGEISWENIVTACMACNLKKGSLPLEKCGMTLKNLPKEPSIRHLQRNSLKYPPKYLHESWIDYLYWETALDQE